MAFPLLPLSLALLLVIHTLVWCVHCSSFPNATTCIRAEREALLKFKQGLVDDSGLLSSWVGDDCCSWKGVKCSVRTGHVEVLDLRSPCVVTDPIDYDPFDPLFIYPGNCSLRGEIHPSLVELQHLKYLDLSWNNFSRTQFPEFLSSLSNLVYLNLSRSLLSGEIPLQLGNLSDLQYLDLNNRHVPEFLGSTLAVVEDPDTLTIKNLEWVSNIASLKHLDLSGISVVNAEGWFRSVAALPSLLHLGLASCSLPSSDPTLPVNFTSLQFLDLSHNSLGSVIPHWLLNLSSITHLHLSRSFQLGSISFPAEIINNNKHLAFLDLSETSLKGELPKNLSNLCHLYALNLYENNLTGDISVVSGNSSRSCFQNKLRYLYLLSNKFSGRLGNEIWSFPSLELIRLGNNFIEGPIPKGLVQLPSLKKLDLSGNRLTGGIPGSIGKMLNLNWLELSSNRLTGGVPESIGQMSDLVRLELDDNLLSGVLTQRHFANLTNLKLLDVSSNHELAVEISATWVPPFQLEWIGMSDCKVGPQFPTWLQSQRSIDFLDLSNASISGVIPDWFYNTSSNISYLVLSKNELTGQIPISACKMKGLSALDLSSNQLSGRLPRCWWKSLSGLQHITLGNNQLTGPLPTSVCSLKRLEFLGLRDNRFYGNLPTCLTSLTSLQVLDLGRNKFVGRIPPWIGSLLYLRVLNLQFNSFDGGIPFGICRLPDLRVLNVAHNHLSGSIPLCMDNLTAMTDQNSGSVGPYGFGVHVILKNSFGVEVCMKNLTLEYTGTLQYLFSIDLSGNNLTGQIPQGLTQLYNLKNLNLSRNQLIGRIPSTIADLKNLESLDLSINQFLGTIPPGLSELDSLGSLNLSYNQLSGAIPSGRHLDTFGNDSYLGNRALCGPPLSGSCWGEHEQPDIHEHSGEDSDAGQDESDIMWFCAGIAPGFAVGFLGACGSLYFNNSWRRSFFLWSDHIFTQLLVILEMSLARLLELFRKCIEKSTW